MLIGIVIIGRNEGERLRRCLSAVAGLAPIVYVDSGSGDDSVVIAKTAGAAIVDLDLSTPFTAARSRNAGAAALLAAYPGTQLIQFIDGDSELEPDWLRHATAEFEARPDLAALSGRIREKSPEASIYNRLAEREWDVPVGEAESCAGICMIRVEAFERVGRFNVAVAAGEEPELCQRLRGAGYRILRTAQPMAVHDISTHRFGQWWRRQVRGGYGGTDVARRFGHPAFARQIRSARVWGVGWPAAIILTGTTAAVWAAPISVAALAAVVSAGPIQVLRIARRGCKHGLVFGDALAYGLLTLIGKWAHLIGQYRWHRDQRHRSCALSWGTSEATPTAH